jgi:hypothetical protein
MRPRLISNYVKEFLLELGSCMIYKIKKIIFYNFI